MTTFIGIKDHMTQTWDKKGKRLAVTVLKAEPMQVVQVKEIKPDGYRAIQVGIGEKPLKQINKPLTAHLKKYKAEKGFKTLTELLLNDNDNYESGAMIAANSVLESGDKVSVTGTSIGKGFAGTVKRHGFKGGPKTHGQSDRQRAPGSIGQGTTPGRIHKGKRMAGHMGVSHFTLKNLTVVKVDEAKAEVWIAGPVPGAKGSLVTVYKKGSNAFAGLPDETEKAAQV